ncbi:hypothetical protein HY639_04705 [Candidatus Woesearchaeota archaeon]|nr:hypothetical protein [Candidatus Woesearchaeota archaeon]
MHTNIAHILNCLTSADELRAGATAYEITAAKHLEVLQESIRKGHSTGDELTDLVVLHEIKGVKGLRELDALRSVWETWWTRFRNAFQNGPISLSVEYGSWHCEGDGSGVDWSDPGGEYSYECDKKLLYVGEMTAAPGLHMRKGLIHIPMVGYWFQKTTPKWQGRYVWKKGPIKIEYDLMRYLACTLGRSYPDPKSKNGFSWYAKKSLFIHKGKEAETLLASVQTEALSTDKHVCSCARKSSDC